MIRSDYIFSAVGKTVTFINPVLLNKIGVIVNIVDGIFIYNSMDPTRTGTFSGNVLTLLYDTSPMSDSDELQIFYSGQEFPPLTNDELRNMPIQVQVIPPDDNSTLFDDSTVQPAIVRPENYGQQLASMSSPVVLANEQIFDYQSPLATFQAPIAGVVIALQDCLQYRSIYAQIITGAGIGAGVITFEQSNDFANWIASPLFDDSVTTTAPVTTLTLAASTNKFFSGPVKYRWHRIRVSTTVTIGTIGCFATYRMAPYSPIVNQIAGSISQWAGTGVVTGGLAGVPAVGGNVAPGVVPTTNPITIGGVDLTRPTPMVRRMVTDTYGHLVAVGPDPNRVDANPVVTIEAMGNLSRKTMAESLDDILWELKLLNYYFKLFMENQLPGQNFDDIESFKQSNKP